MLKIKKCLSEVSFNPENQGVGHINMYVSKGYVLWFLWLLWGRRLNSWVFMLILFFFFPQMRIGNFGYGQSWWWTGKPGMLQSMGLQRVGYDWATELNWTYDKRLQICYREFHTGHGHAQCEIFQLSFFGDKMRSAAWKTAPQIALRDYSKEAVEEV